MRLCYTLLSFLLLYCLTFPVTSQESGTPTKSAAYQHYLEGEALLYKAKLDEAEEAFKKAITLDSTFGPAYYGLAWSIGWARGLGEQAKEPLQKAEALLDDFPDKERYLYRALVASVDLSKSGMEEAVAILKEMEQKYPDDQRMLYYIGDCLYHLSADHSANQHAEAEQYLRKSVEINPENMFAWNHLGMVFADQGKNEEEKQIFQQILEVNPDNPDAYLSYGWSLFNQKKYAEMEELFQKAVHLDSNNVGVLNGLGWSLTNQEKYSEAEEIFLKGNKLEPEHTAIINGLGRLKVISKDYDAAESYYRKYSELQPSWSWPKAALGEIELLRKNYSLAEKHLQEALSMDSTSTWIYEDLGYLFSEQKRYSEAQTYAQQALAIDSSFANYNLLGWVLVAGELDLERGLECTQKALDAKPDDLLRILDARTFGALPEHTLGLVYLKKGQYQKAMPFLEQAAEQMPERQMIQKDLQLTRKKLKETANK